MGLRKGIDRGQEGRTYYFGVAVLRSADIPFSKSSGRQKTPLDDQSGERLCRGGQAILRFLWPIREKLKE
jgi:hypothetical protein